jgi:hypothetical protein
MVVMAPDCTLDHKENQEEDQEINVAVTRKTR